MPRDRRRHTRIKKRFKVDFGDRDLGKSGFAADISVGGLFLATNTTFEVGTRLHLHVIAAEDDFYAEGEVARIKRVDPQLRRVEPQGMGIRLLGPAELVRALVPRLARTVETLELVCQRPDQLERMLREQLSAGVLVVAVPSPPPAPNSSVEFSIRLEFGGRETFHGEGRVIQLLDQGGARRAVLEVRDAVRLRTDLEAAM